MADEHDPQVSSRYRALGAEEPPRALDEAILAAARRPARSWTRRWAVPLSLAAVVVLSVTVTLRIQHEQPALESPAEVRAPASKEAAPPEAAQEQATMKAEKKADKPVLRNEPVPPQPARPAATAASRAARAPASADRLEMHRDAARSAESGAAGAVAPQAAPLEARSKLSADSPERELERIAQLRRDGRHEEADKALAEFRKRRPDYRIPSEVLERVERR